MTAFGGDILVAPNTIDFQLVQQAFDNVDPDDLLVLITLCSTFLVYFLVLVKARRADKVDATKVGVMSLKIIRCHWRYYEDTEFKQRNDQEKIVTIELQLQKSKKKIFKKNEASRRCLILFLFLCDSLIASRLRGSFLC